MRPHPLLAIPFLLAPALVLATEVPVPAASVSAEVDAVSFPEDGLTADEIYQRVLDNRFNSYEQSLVMESGDEGGRIQNVEIDLKYLNFRERSKKILSKTIARYNAPQDVRHLGYLVVNKEDGADDQFVYRPSSRRVRRINLRGEAVSGTDFSFEDILPQEFEDADYERLDDAVTQGRDTYAIQVTPRIAKDSEYSKFVVYVDKSSFVPLRTLYWDEEGLLIKELNAQADSIRMYEDEEDGKVKQVWMTHESKIVHLKLDTWTTLHIGEVKANPGLKPNDFSERQLTASH